MSLKILLSQSMRVILICKFYICWNLRASQSERINNYSTAAPKNWRRNPTINRTNPTLMSFNCLRSRNLIVNNHSAPCLTMSMPLRPEGSLLEYGVLRNINVAPTASQAKPAKFISFAMSLIISRNLLLLADN
jgi:hypothetical protein